MSFENNIFKSWQNGEAQVNYSNLVTLNLNLCFVRILQLIVDYKQLDSKMKKAFLGSMQYTETEHRSWVLSFSRNFIKIERN